MHADAGLLVLFGAACGGGVFLGTMYWETRELTRLLFGLAISAGVKLLVLDTLSAIVVTP